MPSYYDVVALHADADPFRLAILTEEDGTRTYGELADRAARFGVAMRRTLAMAEGERICVWASNRPEWLEAYFGAAASGITSVSANPEWTDQEIGYVLEHSGAVAIVCDAALAQRALALRAGTPSLRHVIALSDSGVATPPAAAGFEDLIAGIADADPRGALVVNSPPPQRGIMYTSGTTTGRPKAVLWELTETTPQPDYVAMFNISARDRAMIITPFFHGNGMGGAISALIHGASMVFPRRFSAARFWPLVDRYRPTYLFTLAPLVNILMGQTPSLHEKTHAFRVMIVLGCAAGAPAIEDRYGAPVIDWFGMTEAGMGTYTRLDEPRKAGSAGRPFPNSGMVILAEDGKPAPVGDVGEVAFERHAVGFQGYINDAEATAAVLDGAYFRTGDMGRFDDEGYFYFVDRKKDIVRRGGENISSMEVEAAMRSHAGVADAAVVAKPDAVLGERVVAFAIAAEGLSQPPDADEVRRHVATQLAHFKVPEQITFLPEFPRTPTGKVEKFRLRQQLV